MNKMIIKLLSLLIITGCGVEAEKIMAKKVKFNELVRTELEADFNKISGDLRSGSIIPYPNISDLDGYSLSLREDVYQGVMGRLRNGVKKSISSIPMAMNNDDKIYNLVKLIQLTGIVSDGAYKDEARVDAGIIQLTTALNSFLSSNPCFEILEPTSEKLCMSSFVEGVTKSSPMVYKMCESLEATVGLFADYDAGQTENHAAIARMCKNADQGRLKTLYTQKGQLYVLQRDYSRYIVSTITESLTDHTAYPYKLVVSGTRYPDDFPIKSSIKFSSDGSDVESMSLYLGSKLFLGFKEFSTSNGLIRIKSFYDDKEIKTKVLSVEIDIQTDSRYYYTIKSDLYFSDMNTFGVRLVGEAEFHYDNGVKRDGVIRLDLQK